MNLLSLFGRQPKVPPPVPERREPQLAIKDSALMASRMAQRPLYGASMLPKPPDTRFAKMPKPPKGVVPKNEAGKARLAMDRAFAQEFYNPAAYGIADGQGWLGFQYLAELTQRPEFRRISEVTARQMTRKWIRLTAAGNKEKGKKLKLLDAAMRRFGVQDLFRRAAEQDGFFGRSQIFIDLGDRDPEELKTELLVKPEKIVKGGLKALRVIEPMWTYPLYYNSTDPLHPAYFKPTTWFVMATEVHSSRLLTFVGREMPDILRPAYSFGGLSLSQMALPYVDNWLRTRQSVSNLLHSFSVMVLKTNMAGTLGGLNDGAEVAKRVALFNNYRDNSGTFVLDKETEEFANVSAPLGSLDKLQAQAQEQQASVSGIPLVVLLGITPTGLNSSTDGEIRSFYDWIHSCQETLFSANLTRVIELIQLNEFGAIDPEIGYEFVPLWQLDEAGRASVQKTKADIGATLVEANAIDPAELRESVANDPESIFDGVDLTGPPPEPEEEPDVTENIHGDPARSAEPRHEERDGV